MKTNYWQKFEENSFYHIYNRGINGENIFLSDDNYQYFLQKWKKLINPYLDVAAYTLMPNHFHFLARVKLQNDWIDKQISKEGTIKSFKFQNQEITFNEFLEDQFKRLFTSYALAFNKQQGRTGSLFQKRFKRVMIKDEYNLWHILAYIHHNPIHHKYCKNYEEWFYSSYNAFFSNSTTSLIRAEVISLFDESDPQRGLLVFKKFHLDFKEDKSKSDLYLE